MTADDPLLADDGWIEYATGNPEFRGRTTIRVESDGRAVVRFVQGDDTQEFVGELSDTRLVEFRETLATHDPRRMQSTRETGEPDEARIRIRYAVGGEEGSNEFWSNEQWEIDGLREVVEAFQGIAAEISDGEVTY